MTTLYDNKAVHILFDTYWISASAGWRRDFNTPPEDLAYAIRKGVMFPPRAFPHDESLARRRKLCAEIKPSEVGDAFLASLSSRELAYRSVLGSYAIAAHSPDRWDGMEVGLVDMAVLNFERLKWGGVRHSQAEYQIFDLEEFRKLLAPQPSAEDVSILNRILASVKTLPHGATAPKLVSAIKGIFASTQDERRIALEILGYAGVLADPGFRHCYDGTEPPEERTFNMRSDWRGPVSYWRSQDGYRVENLETYFPRYVSKLTS